MVQNNNNYSIQGNKLIISGNEIIFDHEIKDILEISDMLIVLMLRPTGITPNRNIYGVSITTKKIKWQIAKLSAKDDDENCPFVGIKYYKNQLYLNNWCDVYLIVDPLTGEILERGLPGKY